ncbi:MAG: Cmr6 family CRISPR-associated RAMP protein [bacterium]|nr:MAG: Cmr6 family CRISPR-associated RAMP protein [bacterium]
MINRREGLEKVSVNGTTNAGLWLDKFITDKENAKTTLVKEVARIPVSEAYKEFYKRWKKTLEQMQMPEGVETKMYIAKVLGRMVVGLGSGSVLETSIKLHHTYGVPYIPGSALKGLTASYATQYLGNDWGKTTLAYKTLFGFSNEEGKEQAAGYVTFFDALYIPGKDQPLHPDIITVHHFDYYQNVKDAAPADWDETNPIPFLSATGSYLLALSGPSSWVDTAFNILRLALKEMGIGAKTSSGYGQMKAKPIDLNSRP